MPSSPFWFADLAALDAAGAAQLQQSYEVYERMAEGPAADFDQLQETGQRLLTQLSQPDANVRAAREEYRGWKQSVQKWKDSTAQLAQAREDFYRGLTESLPLMDRLQQQASDHLLLAASEIDQAPSLEALRKFQAVERAETALKALKGSWQREKENAPSLGYTAVMALQQQHLAVTQLEITLTSALAAAFTPQPAALTVVLPRATSGNAETSRASALQRWLPFIKKDPTASLVAKLGMLFDDKGFFRRLYTSDTALRWSAERALASLPLTTKMPKAAMDYRGANADNLGYLMYVTVIGFLSDDDRRSYSKLYKAALARSPNEWGEALANMPPDGLIDLFQEGRLFFSAINAKGAGSEVLRHVLSAPQLGAARKAMVTHALRIAFDPDLRGDYRHEGLKWLSNPATGAWETLALVASSAPEDVLTRLRKNTLGIGAPNCPSWVVKQLLSLPSLPSPVRADIVALGIRLYKDQDEIFNQTLWALLNGSDDDKKVLNTGINTVELPLGWPILRSLQARWKEDYVHLQALEEAPAPSPALHEQVAAKRSIKPAPADAQTRPAPHSL